MAATLRCNKLFPTAQLWVDAAVSAVLSCKVLVCEGSVLTLAYLYTLSAEEFNP